MTELTLLITLITVLIFLTLAGLVLLADKCLDLAERVRALVHRGSMDAIAIWTSANGSRLDIEERRVKLELGRHYGYLRLRSERARLLAGKGEEQ